jgi:hypothetical protein
MFIIINPSTLVPSGRAKVLHAEKYLCFSNANISGQRQNIDGFKPSLLLYVSWRKLSSDCIHTFSFAFIGEKIVLPQATESFSKFLINKT